MELKKRSLNSLTYFQLLMALWLKWTESFCTKHWDLSPWGKEKLKKPSKPIFEIWSHNNLKFERRSVKKTRILIVGGYGAVEKKLIDYLFRPIKKR